MIFDRIDFLDAARGAARWIENLGVETDEGIFWRCQPEERGGSYTDRLDLYRGSAGKIFFFSQLFRATGDEQYLADALAGAQFVMARFDASALTIGGIPNSAWTLYGGTAGIAFALLDLSRIPGAGSVGERAGIFARACTDKIRAAATGTTNEAPGRTKSVPAWTGEPCVYADGGTILYLLHAAESFGDERYRSLALEAGGALVSRALPATGGAFDTFRGEYFGFSPHVRWPNFELGTAGAAYVFLKLYAAGGGSVFLEAARAGADYIRSVAVFGGSGENAAALVPYRFPDYKTLFYLGYCHGPVGTIRLFYELERITKDEGYGRFWRALVRGILATGAPENHSSGYWHVFSQCCGTAGMAGLFCGLWAATGGAEYLALARRSSAHIAGYAAQCGNGGLAWYQAFERVNPARVTADTGYGVGAAGIGMALLQTHLAERGTFKTVRLPDDPFPERQVSDAGVALSPKNVIQENNHYETEK
jgi:hypothetical protein